MAPEATHVPLGNEEVTIVPSEFETRLEKNHGTKIGPGYWVASAIGRTAGAKGRRKGRCPVSTPSRLRVGSYDTIRCARIPSMIHRSDYSKWPK